MGSITKRLLKIDIVTNGLLIIRNNVIVKLKTDNQPTFNWIIGKLKALEVL
jgi:hypothetical protein